MVQKKTTIKPSAFKSLRLRKEAHNKEVDMKNL